MNEFEFPQFDDVGSFPLPDNIDKESFNRFYWVAYKAIVNKNDIFFNKGIQIYFINPMVNCFKFKLNAGVQIINYPQLMNMHTQFLKPIEDYEINPGLIDLNKACIPEILVIEKFAKKYYEDTSNPIKIKICVTGPIELYVKQHSFTVYNDLALNFAKSVNYFLKNSILNNKYLKTSVIAIDEPSFGYTDLLNISDDEIIKVFDKSLDGVKTKDNTTQIHIHTLNRADIPLESKNIDVLTCEYASNKSNKISKKILDRCDKFIRVGISRTNIDNIIAETIDSGKTWEYLKTTEGMMSLIDSKERIKKNLLDALELYKERLRFVGPDCGLGGWPSQKVASELLFRTSEVIKEVKLNFN